ncbi:hypothetical protein C8Q79DRAFT_901740 [Trametes meyenii]|nr:hypothetical protein C8Q79DRAFT_901740 [Trametes meyenii]
MYNRPSLDLALYAIVTQALPPYRQKLAEILHDSRDGRAPALSDTQASFKHAWEHLLKVPIKGEYTVDLAKWTCNCGAQKYHSHLLCKHLVQAAGAQPDDWWPNVVRYHIPPFYVIPSSGAVPPESMRSHAWLSRMRERPSIIIHRPRAPTPLPDTSDSETDGSSNDPAASEGIISSPDKAPPSDGILRERAGGGAGFDLDNAADDDLDEVERRLRAAIEELPRQAKNPDPRFFRSSIERSFRGMIHWVCDVLCTEYPDLKTITPEEVCTYLARALELFWIERARADGDLRLAMHAKARLRGVLEWVSGVEHRHSRRTLPLTNARRSGQPEPSRFIGYYYRERES